MTVLLSSPERDSTVCERIPIAQPIIGREETAAVSRVLCSGKLAQGEVVTAFETAFAAYLGCELAVATSSGTTALHLALLAHRVGLGDEVITTPFTFAATVSAIVQAGATPVFVDVDPHTLNLSPAAVAAAVTERTRAIVPVHLYGNPCEMASLTAIAEAHGLALIEDACQAHGAEFEGRRVGTFGTGCFSFYPTKNMTSGEGGMVVTSDPEIAERVALLRNHGMRERYHHEQIGFNYRMSDIHAAVGLVQLGRLDEFNAQRAANAAFYDQHLGIPRPTEYPEGRSAWHLYTLLVNSAQREALAAELPKRGIDVGIYYPKLVYQQPAYRAFGVSANCPVAESVCGKVLSIPVHPAVGPNERRRVVAEVQDVLKRL